MTSRQLATSLTQRAAKTASFAALSLGLAATVFAPLTAQAAPSPSDVQPDGSPDLVISLGRAATAQGDPLTLDVDVRNAGSGTVSSVDFRLILSFDTSGWTSRDWSVSGEKADGTRVNFGCVRVAQVQPSEIACRLDSPLNGGESHQLQFTMRNGGPGEYTIAAEVDNGHLVRESDEQNNMQSLTTVID